MGRGWNSRSLQVVAVTLLLVLASLQSQAQTQSAGRGERAAPRNPAASQSNSAATEQTKPWSLDDALPDNSPAAQTQRPKTAPTARPAGLEPAKPELGRVPLRSGQGSFGIETETKVKSTEFPDGRRAPGVDSTQHKPPSYFGLSISVPTADK